MHLAVGLYGLFQINFELMSPRRPAEEAWVDTASRSTVSEVLLASQHTAGLN